MSTPVDPYSVPDDLAERFLQVREIAEALRKPGTGSFLVMLTKYIIEGEAYAASALTVSPTATPNFSQTQTGFTCDAFFSPDLLTPNALQGKTAHHGRVTVRLEARLADIIMIVPMQPGA